MTTVYLDTGFFVDYFSQRSLVATNMRGHSRRRRTVKKIQDDAVSVMKALGSHNPVTSVLTVLEYRDNTYAELKRNFKGLSDIKVENLMKTKAEASIFCIRCRRNKITLVPLAYPLLDSVLNNPEYNELELNDALHIQTARTKRVEIVVSTDADLLKFDKAFDKIRIVDTDEALKLL